MLREWVSYVASCGALVVNRFLCLKRSGEPGPLMVMLGSLGFQWNRRIDF